MQGNRRPIDDAMSADRPAKRSIRELWIEAVREHEGRTQSEVPLYLTMPGAAGYDIQLLIDRGIVEVTESGAIADTANPPIVAVEKDSLAILEIQRRFPGLKVLESDLLNALHGTSSVTFPGGSQRDLFRATVVNLDFNGPLLHVGTTFPMLEAVVKLAALHTHPTWIDWTLLLTIHAEILWSESVQEDARRFLGEHCSLHAPLNDGCRALLGEGLHERLFAADPINLRSLSVMEQQIVLMAFVPVRIARQVHATGWRIEVVHNLRYGGEAGTAPMVTWVMDFIADSRALATPQTVLKEGLDTVLRGAGYVGIDGVVLGLP